MFAFGCFFIYKVTVGPILRIFAGPGFDSCKYVPTCSEYAAETLSNVNSPLSLVRAIRLIVLRILSCNPWSKEVANV